MNDLELVRNEKYSDRTIGGLYLPDSGSFRYYTLEDTDRKLEAGGVKIPGRTAIPTGRYRITFDWSPKRHGLVPYLLDVPQFIAIQVHAANKPEDVEGCIGIGLKYNAPKHEIYESILAIQEFYPWLFKALLETNDNLWITVR
jgi:hypothetical protein